MKKIVILGFHDSVNDRRYYVGDVYESEDAERVEILAGKGLIEGAADAAPSSVPGPDDSSETEPTEEPEKPKEVKPRGNAGGRKASTKD
ncbi:hypothetical protein [Paenibacillus harenae]|uniref:hypothetical protein n=1 Tax=Paenibacillus harenae TaxID=306543 RepID=UPI000423640A|nr:hypothetical protein [Paenibacillus harenae]